MAEPFDATGSGVTESAMVGTKGPAPKVLVLLAAYNGERWIHEQIESVLAQQGVDLQILIRDDGSSDGTLKEIDRYADNPRVTRLVSSPPTGSAAQNFFSLIRENSARGFDFVALSDQDDIWYLDRLERAGRVLEGSDSVGYSSATLARWENGGERLITLSGGPTRSDFLFEGAGQGCTFVLTAAFFERVRNFISAQPQLTRQLHFHDWTIYALARAWDLKWTFDRSPSVIYRQHSRNDIGSRGSLHGAMRRFARVRNGWYREQLERICLLCTTAAPQNTIVADWRTLLLASGGWRRKLQIAALCLRRGRRRTLDNLIIGLAAVAGWI